MPRGPVVLAAVGLIVAVATWALVPSDPARLAGQAEAAARAGDWAGALERWRAVNRTDRAGPRSLLGEARAWLALGHAARAERALARAGAEGPADPAPWLLRLGLLHVEDRTVEAHRVGLAALAAVPPSARREVLRALTRALLSDTPDDLARATLGRWVSADPDDIDARVALLGRMAALPRAGDPDRAARIATLTGLLARDPGHLGAREALVVALADAGEPDRGRAVLDAWPAEARDARYARLRGRWDLDYDRQPARAAEAFRLALADLPHDWKTHYRLARALTILGRPDDARREAETVARLREALDPVPLGRRLAADFAHPDDPKSRLDLAELCATLGLDHLADAWRSESGDHSPAPTAHGFDAFPFGPPTGPSSPRRGASSAPR